jgi:hypothetical protein
LTERKPLFSGIPIYGMPAIDRAAEHAHGYKGSSYTIGEARFDVLVTPNQNACAASARNRLRPLPADLL